MYYSSGGEGVEDKSCGGNWVKVSGLSVVILSRLSRLSSVVVCSACSQALYGQKTVSSVSLITEADSNRVRA